MEEETLNNENGKAISHVDCPTDAPMDGVQMKTDCIRTDFIDNPGVGEEVFRQSEKSEARISASVEIGILSIRDLATGVMLTVSIQDAMELIASALDSVKEGINVRENRTLQKMWKKDNVPTDEIGKVNAGR